MKSKRIKVKEGDVFAVPLKDNGYVIGIVTRVHKKMKLGYFFNKIYPDVPADVPAADLDKSKTILIGKFSSLGIDEGEWPMLNSPIVFERDEWPVPVFKMQEPISKKFMAIVYDETLLKDKRYVITDEEAKPLFDSGLMGYGFVSARLTRLLRQAPITLLGTDT